MTPLEVVGLGAMNIDHLCRVKSIPVDGETVVEEIRSSPGGSAANTIYALAKLGIRTGFIGAVGDDEDGTALLADFNSVEVDTSMVRIHKNTRTGSALCISDHQGNRQVTELRYILTPHSEGNFTLGPAQAKIGLQDKSKKGIYY